MLNTVPVIDLHPLIIGADPDSVASGLRDACSGAGFFYVLGHGVDEGLQGRLEELSRAFFAMGVEEKMKIRMALGGRAWRGYFPVGDELTSGKPDIKEGLYFGAELSDDHPHVRLRTPLHGRNLFPDEPPEMRSVVLEYMAAMTRLGHLIMSGIALSLGLERTYFTDGLLSDPLTLFRIFHYPPTPGLPDGESAWGVGEHTDYGILTILKQDDVGGLQVKSKREWITAHPIPNTFVCNIGDMLDRMTGGFYRSTPHRVRNLNPVGRLTFRFFFDPGFDAEIHPIEFADRPAIADDAAERWDRASVHAFEGTYGEYLLAKVSKVFPGLA